MPTEPRYKIVPYAHQRVDVLRIIEDVEPEIERIFPRCVLIAYEQRVGKTKLCVDAIQLLFERGRIDRAIVITLNGVKSEWYHPEFGQIFENLWDDLPARVFWVHSQIRRWERLVPGKAPLDWFVSNYDFIRGKAHLPKILRLCDARTVLVLDESSAIGNATSKQSRAVQKIRAKCGWVFELNGTPVPDSPAGVYGQARVLDPRILGVKGLMGFRAAYAITGGPRGNWIFGWKNLDDLQAKMAPYVIRRLKKDCLDLPPKLPPVTLTATLSKETWKIYKDLRDEFVAWITKNSSVTAAQAVVRSTRLSQITSGILAGVRSVSVCGACDGCDKEDGTCTRCDGLGFVQEVEAESVVGNEKVDAMAEWLRAQWEENPKMRVIVWCRFRSEVSRAVAAIKDIGVEVCQIVGGQTKDDRDRALRLMHPKTKTDAPVAMVGNPSAGGIGLNLAAASCMLHLSHLPSNYIYEQSNERPHGPGQTEPVAYFDMIAEGPNGERTMDHAVLKALREKKKVADAITSAWLRQ